MSIINEIKGLVDDAVGLCHGRLDDWRLTMGEVVDFRDPLDEKGIFAMCRRVAAERGTTASAVLREHLEALAKEHGIKLPKRQKRRGRKCDGQ